MTDGKGSTEAGDRFAHIDEVRGYPRPDLAWFAREDPELAEAYLKLTSLCLLHEDAPKGERAVGAKVREFVAIGLLCYRANERGVLNHMRRAVKLGATKRELLEVCETTLIPGGAPTFSLGVRAIMQLEREGTFSGT